MLDSVLKFFADEINGYLQARTGVLADTVVLSAIVDDTGKYAMEDDSLTIYIINIEEDSVNKEQLPRTVYRDGQHIVLAPPLNLNISIMFAANYGFYDQALKYISHILTYFQSRRVFSPAEYAAMDNRLQRLVVELQSLNYDQLNQVWAYIGAKQLPSVVYRVRAVILQDEAQSEVRPPIFKIKTDVGGM